MKIQNSSQVMQALRTYQKNKAEAPKKTGEAGAVRDKIELSQKAQEFQVALKAYQKLPEIREDRVEEVKAKMARNEGPTPEEVADRMIAGLNLKSKF